MFKEYTVNQYLENENQYEVSKAKFLDWEEFGKWCEERETHRKE